MTAAARVSHHGTRPDAREVVRAVVVPFVVARLVVFSALAITRHLLTELGVVPPPIQAGQGLLAWDAAFYADIAHGGYAAVPKEGLRFFPLVPLVARSLAIVPAVDTDLALLVVTNAAAFVFAVVLVRLVWLETHDFYLARRAVWIAALAPPAFVLTMGYAESTLMLLAAATFLALRERRFWTAALLGVAAGLCRPIGIYLVIPAAIEALRGARRARVGSGAARLAAVGGPAAGTLAYLLWVRDRTGDFFYAFRAHESPELRGRMVNPISNVVDAARDLGSGERVGSGLHFASAIALLVLLVVLARHWPASYTAYAGAGLLVALTGDNLDSLERYGLSVFPFVLAAATLVGERSRQSDWGRAALAVAGAGLFGASVLAFTGVLVP